VPDFFWRNAIIELVRLAPIAFSHSSRPENGIEIFAVGRPRSPVAGKITGF
jgi:hypothetical protein